MLKVNLLLFIVLNSILITFVFSITEDDKNSYINLVSARKKMKFDETTYANNANLYNPENSDYSSSTYSQSIVYFILSGLVMSFLIYYIVSRFVLKWFLGGKSHHSKKHLRFSFLLIGLGLLVSSSLLITSIIYGSSIRNSDKKYIEEINKVNSDDEKFLSLIDEKLKVLSLVTIENFSYSLYKIYKGIDELKLNIKESQSKRDDFAKTIQDKNKFNFYFSVSSLIIIFLITLLTIVLRVFVKNEIIVEITSLLLVLFISLSFAARGISHAHFIQKIDFCSEVNTFQLNEFTPFEGVGIGNHFQCLSENNLFNAHVNKHEYYTSAKNIIAYLEKSLNNTFSYSNLSFIEEQIQKNPVKNQKFINAFSAVKSYNELINAIKDRADCISVGSLMTSAEDNFCVNLSKVLICIYLNIFAIFFYLPLAYGLNRLSIGIDVDLKHEEKQFKEIMNDGPVSNTRFLG